MKLVERKNFEQLKFVGQEANFPCGRIHQDLTQHYVRMLGNFVVKREMFLNLFNSQHDIFRTRTLWCSGITAHPTAGGPLYKSQLVHQSFFGVPSWVETVSMLIVYVEHDGLHVECDCPNLGSTSCVLCVLYHAFHVHSHSIAYVSYVGIVEKQ